MGDQEVYIAKVYDTEVIGVYRTREAAEKGLRDYYNSHNLTNEFFFKESNIQKEVLHG